MMTASCGLTRIDHVGAAARVVRGPANGYDQVTFPDT